MKTPTNQSISTNTNTKTNDFKIKYKTQVTKLKIRNVETLYKWVFVPTYIQQNYLTQCTFAHDDSQIRQKANVSKKYKTKPCINFQEKGFCTYGDRCQYLHLSNNKTYRSNSEDLCDRLKRNQPWSSHSRMTYNKRIEVIQSLGLDFTVRNSSRLLQMLRSNEAESEYSTDDDWSNEIQMELRPKIKKYSL